MADLFIGTSGFSYKHWAGGLFYPEGLPEQDWLKFYARTFKTVEINSTFYNLPKETVFAGWHNKTPAGFRFALKGSRFITHYKKLKNVEDAVSLFFDNAQALKEKLAVVLWQLPGNFVVNKKRLNDFCDLLTANAIAGKTRQAFEFRHESWFTEEVCDILKKNNMALCIAHSGYWPSAEITSADFAYFRFHGGEELYGSKYSLRELAAWAAKMKRILHQGQDIYAYFNNDAYGYALENALKLRDLIRY
jgi:uncharacterized protein YecE (DUF72 family)